MDPPVVDILAADTDELFAAIDAGSGRTATPTSSTASRSRRCPASRSVDLEMNPGQEFLHLLSDPNIAFLLFTIGFYGILAELFHPNFLSGILGAIAIVLALIGSNASRSTWAGCSWSSVASVSSRWRRSLPATAC